MTQMAENKSMQQQQQAIYAFGLAENMTEWQTFMTQTAARHRADDSDFMPLFQLGGGDETIR